MPTQDAAETELFDQLARELYSAVISDVLDDLGHRDQAMTAGIQPAYPGAALVGRAHTVVSTDAYHVPEDNPYGLMMEAIDNVPRNGVVVGATGESTRTCMWGELLSTACQVRGGRGAVVDGYTRDVRMIEEMGFPVFATGRRPVDSLGRGRIIGYGEPVVCGGVRVNPGDIVFADVDGVVVIPQEVEDAAIERAREKVSGEGGMRRWLSEGRTLQEAFDHFGIL